MLPSQLLARPAWLAAGVMTLLLVFMFSLHPPSQYVAIRPSKHQAASSEQRRFSDRIRNETLGFEKIYVINLPSRTDHKDSMSLAAHFTGITVDYVDGIKHVDEKTLPPHEEGFGLPQEVLGAWRAHLNIARQMVEQNISSALILEDDSDWDLRLKSQMESFAAASRIMLQPKLGASSGDEHQHWDPSNPRNSQDEQVVSFPLDDGEQYPTIEPSDSPYGDLNRWDILWLGHCGTHFPRSTDKMPLGRVSYNDETVPEPQHIGIQFGITQELTDDYPPHTRVVHRAAGNVCTLAYAISLPGARRLLYELSMRKITSATDIMLDWLCEGIDGRKMRNCLSVQPQLFQHHRAVGPKSAQSDIVSHGDEYNNVAFSRNIRWSTRINMPKLVEGDTDYIDTFPDGAEAMDLGF